MIQFRKIRLSNQINRSTILTSPVNHVWSCDYHIVWVNHVDDSLYHEVDSHHIDSLWTFVDDTSRFELLKEVNREEDAM